MPLPTAGPMANFTREPVVKATQGAPLVTPQEVRETPVTGLPVVAATVTGVAHVLPLAFVARTNFGTMAVASA